MRLSPLHVFCTHRIHSGFGLTDAIERSTRNMQHATSREECGNGICRPCTEGQEMSPSFPLNLECCVLNVGCFEWPPQLIRFQYRGHDNSERCLRSVRPREGAVTPAPRRDGWDTRGETIVIPSAAPQLGAAHTAGRSEESPVASRGLEILRFAQDDRGIHGVWFLISAGRSPALREATLPESSRAFIRELPHRFWFNPPP